MTNWIELFKNALGLDADKKAHESREKLVWALTGVVAEMNLAVNSIDKNMSIALVHYGKHESVQIVVSRNRAALGTCVSIKLANEGYPLHVVSARDKKINSIDEFEAYMKEVVTDKESQLILMLKETLMPEKEVESLGYHIPTQKQKKALAELGEGNPPSAAPQLEAPTEELNEILGDNSEAF